RSRVGGAWCSGRLLHVGGQVLLRNLGERGEGGGVVHREVRENLAVHLDTSGLEALDEAVVGDAVLTGRRVDTGDPELAEVTLASPAVPVGVVERVERLLLGLAVQARTLAAVTTGQFESCATLLLGIDCPLDACHGSILSCRGAQPRRPGGLRRTGSAAEQPLDAAHISGRDLGGALEPTSHPARLLLQQMPPARLLAPELAAARHADALRHPAMGLVLRHYSLFQTTAHRSPVCCCIVAMLR